MLVKDLKEILEEYDETLRVAVEIYECSQFSACDITDVSIDKDLGDCEKYVRISSY